MGGTFTLVITGPSNAPTHLAIIRTGSTTPIVNIDIPSNATWNTGAESRFGFSPDGNDFVVHYQSGGGDWIYLYNLIAATPNIPAWKSESFPINTNPGALVTSPSGSMAFSPNGKYLVATQLQTQPNNAQRLFLYLVSESGALVPSPISDWTPSAPPVPDKEVHSAHWGFSPDDQTFVMILQDTSPLGTRLEMIGLPTGTLVQEYAPSATSWYVQFSPCSDALGIVTDDGSKEAATLSRPRSPRQKAARLGQWAI